MLDEKQLWQKLIADSEEFRICIIHNIPLNYDWKPQVVNGKLVYSFTWSTIPGILFRRNSEGVIVQLIVGPE